MAYNCSLLTVVMYVDIMKYIDNLNQDTLKELSQQSDAAKGVCLGIMFHLQILASLKCEADDITKCEQKGYIIAYFA